MLAGVEVYHKPDSMHATVKHSFQRDMIMDRSAALVSTYVIDRRSSLTSFVTNNN